MGLTLHTQFSTLAIMEGLKNKFAECKAEGRPALVTYVTAGYPTPAETVDVMLGMEAGGSDVIELGITFTDPIADGVTIQKANHCPHFPISHRQRDQSPDARKARQAPRRSHCLCRRWLQCRRNVLPLLQ